jgi:hypothetical protein
MKWLVIIFGSLLSMMNSNIRAQVSNVIIINQGSDTICNKARGYCKTYTLVRMPHYFSGYGTILKDTISSNNRYNGFKEISKHHVPGIREIEKAENLLDSQNLSVLGQKETGFFKKRYKKYYRQYSGYMSGENDTIIVVNLLDFANKTKARRFFKSEWKYRNYGIVIPCTDCRYPVINSFEVNLGSSEIKKVL